MGDDHPGVYENEAGEIIYRASAFGSCIRSVSALRKGLVPNLPSERMQLYFDEGHEHEEEILDRFHDKIGKKSWERMGGQGEVRLSCGKTEEGQAIWIVGHFDEKFCNRQTGEIRLAEAKFLAPSTYKKTNLASPDALTNLPYYLWQQNIYMLASKVSLWFVVGLKDRDDEGVASLSSDESAVVYRHFETPSKRLVDVLQRVRTVEKSLDGGLPECDHMQYPCPFYGSICGSKQLAEKLKKEKGGDRHDLDWNTDAVVAFEAAMVLYEHGRIMEDEGKGKKRQANEIIKSIHVGLGLQAEEDGTLKHGGLEGGKWEMDWVSFTKQGNVDWDKVPEGLKKEVDGYRGERVLVEYPKIHARGIQAMKEKQEKEGKKLLGDNGGQVEIKVEKYKGE